MDLYIIWKSQGGILAKNPRGRTRGFLAFEPSKGQYSPGYPQGFST